MKGWEDGRGCDFVWIYQNVHDTAGLFHKMHCDVVQQKKMSSKEVEEKKKFNVLSQISIPLCWITFFFWLNGFSLIVFLSSRFFYKLNSFITSFFSVGYNRQKGYRKKNSPMPMDIIQSQKIISSKRNLKWTCVGNIFLNNKMRYHIVYSVYAALASILFFCFQHHRLQIQHQMHE